MKIFLLKVSRHFTLYNRPLELQLYLFFFVLHITPYYISLKTGEMNPVALCLPQEENTKGLVYVQSRGVDFFSFEIFFENHVDGVCFCNFLRKATYFQILVCFFIFIFFNLTYYFKLIS